MRFKVPSISSHVIVLLVCCTLGCNKSSYLDAKPDQSLTLLETLEDLQTLIDNTNVMNGSGQGLVPVVGEIAAGDFFHVNGFNSGSSDIFMKDLYVWKDVVTTTYKLYDWDYPYRCIFYSNTVLDGLKKINSDAYEIGQYNYLKGAALFLRAHMYYQLAQIYCPVFNESTAGEDLGIPLKSESDVNESLNRSSLQETYNKIINDLKEAAENLVVVPKHSTRPSRPAAFALLARVYLSMQKYDSSLKYSNKCLELFDHLIDFNDNNIVDQDGGQGIRRMYNPEILWDCKLIETNVDGLMHPYFARVDSSLYSLYQDNDLRKNVYFLNDSYWGNAGNHYFFKGSYSASTSNFAGLATDEVILIRAESYAREGNKDLAMQDLNRLLEKRWKAGKFIPLTAVSALDALQKILIERRKELLFRGVRWTDLRRLNKEGANISLTRIIDNESYTLPPNDKRYTFLIPTDVMQFNPKWQQNPR